jgi:hypothetical protein
MVSSPLFRMFMSCDIPSFYKIFLTAYLCSYASGGAYIIVFTISSTARILDGRSDISALYAFTRAGVILFKSAPSCLLSLDQRITDTLLLCITD